jgi:protein ImuB
VSATRTLVVWGPDWPVVAARREGAAPPDLPVAVLRANRVVAVSPDARAGGVTRGMRRREAQARCGALELVVDDPDRDARAFEPVLQVIERVAPLVEVVRPGLAQLATRGPSRYHGGDAALVSTLIEMISALTIDVRIGVADGPFAAALAARAGVIVEPGTSPAFLADHPIGSLVASGAERLGDAAAHRRAGRVGRWAAGAVVVEDLAELVELLGRLGLRTLGSFAGLPATDVLARFGPLGARAHRLASGLDERPLDPTPIPPDLAASMELDPPVDRVDTAAFVARSLAEELHERLQRHGLTCLRVRIEARTVGGTTRVRLWRHERSGAAGGLTAQGLADRVRWQLDGWLRASERGPGGGPERGPGGGPERGPGRGPGGGPERGPGGGPERGPGGGPERGHDHDLDPASGEEAAIVHLLLAPDEVVPDEGRQLGLWGGASDADRRAARALARVQGLLGPDAVRIPVVEGGRGSSPVRLVTWGDQRADDRAASIAAERGDGPPLWPGRLPSPLPPVVHDPPLPATVLDAGGRELQVSGRGVLSGDPAMVAVGGSVTSLPGPPEPVTAWAGPWPVDERWWDATAHRRAARLQLALADGRVLLVSVAAGSWWWEACWS